MSTVTGRQASNVKFAIVVCAVLIGAAGCSDSHGSPDRPSPGTPPPAPAVSRANPAVQRVMNTYNSLIAKYQNVPRDIAPAQYAANLGEICAVLEKQDMAGCPRDFRVACEHNIRALRDAQDAVQQYPESIVEAVATGAMNYWVHKENDGGVSRLRGEVKTALDRVRATSDEVERIGAKYTD